MGGLLWVSTLIHILDYVKTTPHYISGPYHIAQVIATHFGDKVPGAGFHLWNLVVLLVLHKPMVIPLISMGWHKIFLPQKLMFWSYISFTYPYQWQSASAVTPLLTHWSCNSFALTHPYHVDKYYILSPTYSGALAVWWYIFPLVGHVGVGKPDSMDVIGQLHHHVGVQFQGELNVTATRDGLWGRQKRVPSILKYKMHPISKHTVKPLV